jgi:hypothetical protein
MYAIEDKDLRKSLGLASAFLGHLLLTYHPAEGPLPSTRSNWGVAPARCTRGTS